MSTKTIPTGVYLIMRLYAAALFLGCLLCLPVIVWFVA